MRKQPWYFNLIPQAAISYIEERMVLVVSEDIHDKVNVNHAGLAALFEATHRPSASAKAVAEQLQKPFAGHINGHDGFTSYDRFRIRTFGFHAALVRRLNQVADRYRFDQETADDLYDLTDQLGAALFVWCGSSIHPLRRDLTNITGPVVPFVHRQDWREEEGGDQ